MSYADLHFDAKTTIARTSIAAWNALMRSDPEFGRYALSDRGRSMFLTAFTVVDKGMWTLAGKLHRIGGPAIIHTGGMTESWYERGQLHRIDGQPARTFADGSTEWFERGQRHRIGGPACIWADGIEMWYEHGELHRTGGQPARNYADGSISWYERGRCHRIGGPAIIYANGSEAWYCHGVQCSPDDVIP